MSDITSKVRRVIENLITGTLKKNKGLGGLMRFPNTDISAISIIETADGLILTAVDAGAGRSKVRVSIIAVEE